MPGEACTLAYWLANFQTWRDEVDELYVLINNLYYPDLGRFAREAIEAADGTVTFITGRVQHGDCIDALVATAHAKDPNGLVVLVEDDAYVRTPGKVRECFDRIEAGLVDVIGSPRYQDRITDPVEGSWGPLTKDWSEIGRVLWPTFLFARSADLMATNRRYGYDTWQVGETIAGLDIEVTPELCAYINTGSYAALDVFYGTSYQLRAAGLRIEHINRVRPWLPEPATEWVKEDPPWVHITEVSTILGAVMPLIPGEQPDDDFPDKAPGGGRWTRCVAWWDILGRTEVAIPGHNDRFRGWLDRFIEVADIDRAEMARWQERFEPWVTW